MRLEEARQGMRVQTIDEHLGPSFPVDAMGSTAYTAQPKPMRWHGTVARVSPSQGNVWVQWDIERNGRTKPMRPEMIEPAGDVRDLDGYGQF